MGRWAARERLARLVGGAGLCLLCAEPDAGREHRVRLLRAGSGRSAGADYGALGDCCSDCRWEFELSMAVWTVGGSLDCRW